MSTVPHIDELDPSEPLILKPGQKIHLENGRSDGQKITIVGAEADRKPSFAVRVIGSLIVGMLAIIALLGGTALSVMLINFIADQAK